MNRELIQQELESLLRTLDFIQEEQTHIKRKLSSLLEKSVASSILTWAEELHQHIFNREMAIQLLKKDTVALRSLLQTNVKSIDPIVITNLKKYKQQVVYLENEFMNWKHDVDNELEFSVAS